MAISQMRKLSLIGGKEVVDDLLETLQQSQLVEVRDLKQLDDWRKAYQEKRVTLPQLYYQSGHGNSDLMGEDALQYLLQRQDELEQCMAQLEAFLPKLGKIASLRQPERSLSFEAFEQKALETQAQNVLQEVKGKLTRLKQLEQSIASLQQQVDEVSKWEKLNVLPDELANSRFISARIGTIPSTKDDSFYHGLMANRDIEVEEVFRTALEYGVIVFWNNKNQPDLDSYQFKPLTYAYKALPKDQLTIFNKQLEVMQNERKGLLEQLAVSQENLAHLQVETDYILSLYLRQKTKQKLASTAHLVALEGWVEACHLGKLRQMIARRFGDAIYVKDSEVPKEDWEQVPIKLRNHALVEPFELVTEMYALPKYHEKDPTPFLAPFYFTFFGMMVADLGYGVLLYLLTALALRAFTLSKESRRSLKFFNLLGISVAIWGLIYGSAFGFELPVALLSTKSDIISIIILSLVFGFVTLIFGLLLGGFQKYRMKDYAGAYHSGFAWVFILIGILLLILGNVLPGFAYLTVIGKFLAIVNVVGILLASVIQSKGLSGLGSGLYNLYGASAFLGDMVSFTRLMALGLSGASIGSAFNMIVGIFPPIGRFSIGIIVFILLHMINLFLSMLSGYVHGARLIFVEFFGKFYEGGGKAFAPFTLAEKYVKINQETQLEEK
ncbi:V-type ATP synthase subunit I [Streptococcus phocae subsp. salmonis]|uniref:V-type ATP synthase subunit I n=1 Tax=Streptococcus phocae TaxID=119224 RepID=UPI0005317B71|nr:V-type ATP synthase subunit I [Streptococcus phocae]KGR72799.1 ATP synthase subunit I [Streptococcus phocae subsp. salmonis]